MLHVLVLIPKSIEDPELGNIISTATSALKQVNGLLAITINDGNIMSPGGPPPYVKVIEASYESLEVFMDWAQTPAAQVNEDLYNESGVVRLFYEVNEF